MKRFCILLFVAIAAAGSEPFTATHIDKIDGAFAPGEDCEKLICNGIAGAKQRVWIQMYNFTSSAIAQAMSDAKKRGLDVKFIGDRSVRTEKNSQLSSIAAAGVECWLDGKHPIAHNKILIIDDAIVGTGSFNYSEHAKKNAENYLLITCKELNSFFATNFIEHLQHSEKYSPAGQVIEEPTQAPSAAPAPEARKATDKAPDKVDPDGVPVYRNGGAPPGVIFRKRSIEDKDSSSSGGG